MRLIIGCYNAKSKLKMNQNVDTESDWEEIKMQGYWMRIAKWMGMVGGYAERRSRGVMGMKASWKSADNRIIICTIAVERVKKKC
jgi:hypothetical protein